MNDDQTVTMTRAEWKQVVGILAQATGWPTVNKLFTQLMREEGPKPPNGEDSVEVFRHRQEHPDIV